MLGVLLVGACGGDVTAPITTASLVGTYDLVSVDGKPLPYYFPPAPNNGVLYAERMEFRSGGTFTALEINDSRVDPTRRDTTTYSGSWEFRGRSDQGYDAVWLTQDVRFASSFPRRVSAAGQTLNAAQGRFVYRRR